MWVPGKLDFTLEAGAFLTVDNLLNSTQPALFGGEASPDSQEGCSWVTYSD